MTFQPRRKDLPPCEHIKLQHVVLYFGRLPGSTFEFPVTHPHFSVDEAESSAPAGGEASTIDGIASARRGNAPAWPDLQWREPFGRNELARPDKPEIRPYLENEAVEENLFVTTYQGKTPDWPA